MTNFVHQPDVFLDISRCSCCSLFHFPLELVDGMAEEEEPLKKKSRFGECSSTDVDSLLKSRVPKTTVVATDFWMKILLSYITEKKLTVKLDTSPITEVATLSSISTWICAKRTAVYTRGPATLQLVQQSIDTCQVSVLT